MSRISEHDATKFLLSCVRHSNNGKINFEEVATECGITSKGAAAKRYERLVKAHSSTTKAAPSTNDENANANANTGAAETPKKGRSPAKRKTATASAKRAAKKAKGNSGGAAEAENEEVVSNNLSKSEMKKLDDELDAANVSEDDYAASEKTVSGEISEGEMKKLDEELDAAEGSNLCLGRASRLENTGK
ncbi:hypothetical protein P168DRAFT_281111 [Aspergillus campestris IBT 28561]|uniref:Myb-like DNA-binding domain-containing protein n=1 Tax=Aspergillus campestris (strain IBT 28561) TaxID=1392248 RepID=A0A2I1D4D3_ASPC2|nr:uncharacterized protein P168DRAFT_281111 [Aspergillus campestris IBT 28561]PKY04734.1 hypothetical protein P168DRAFT_281111 [Aspergillus campestris IBT 28561]